MLTAVGNVIFIAVDAVDASIKSVSVVFASVYVVVPEFAIETYADARKLLHDKLVTVIFVHVILPVETLALNIKPDNVRLAAPNAPPIVIFDVESGPVYVPVTLILVQLIAPPIVIFDIPLPAIVPVIFILDKLSVLQFIELPIDIFDAFVPFKFPENVIFVVDILPLNISPDNVIDAAPIDPPIVIVDANAPVTLPIKDIFVVEKFVAERFVVTIVDGENVLVYIFVVVKLVQVIFVEITVVDVNVPPTEIFDKLPPVKFPIKLMFVQFARLMLAVPAIVISVHVILVVEILLLFISPESVNDAAPNAPPIVIVLDA